jgi:hypothetical protein
MRKSLLNVPILLLIAAFATLTAHADTYTLNGVTLVDGGTVVGQFDWNDVPSSYSFTNVNILITGAGPQLGLSTTITSPDPLNPGGLCFSDPPVGTGLCSSPSLVFVFDQRLTPNSTDPTAPPLLSDEICIGPCFGANESHVTFSDGTSVAITAGSVTDTTVPEPGTLMLMLIGLGSLGVMAVMRKRKAESHPQST